MAKAKDIVTLYTLKAIKEKEFKYNATIESKNDVVDFLRFVGLHENCEEVFALICMNTKGNIIGFHEVSRGELSATLVHPREVFKRAIVNNAKSIIIAHNHPSGDTSPSDADRMLTERLVGGGKLLGIELLDHIIISDYESTSLREIGVISLY